MSDWEVLPYKNIYVGSINYSYYSNEVTGAPHSSIYMDRRDRNTYACFSKLCRRRAAACYLDEFLRFTWCGVQPQKLYIVPGCKVPRDLYRNSGYSIVREQEKADWIVVPTLRDENTFYYYNIICYDISTDSLYLYTIDKQEEAEDGVLFEKIKEYLLKWNPDLVFYQDNIIYNDAVVQLIPKQEVYKDILLETYPNRQYCSELSVSLDYPNVINPETLMLWERRDDADLLTKTIVASDWKDYPATLCVFLATEQPFLYMYGNDQFKFVLQQIGYKKHCSARRMIEGRVIEPKDWNMLQSYIMAKMNLDEKGGFVDFVDYNEVSDYQKLFRRKMAVAPIKIDTPMRFENIVATIK